MLCLYHPPQALAHLHKHPRDRAWIGRTINTGTVRQDPAAGGGQQGYAENPLAALLSGIPDFNTEELEALLRDLPIPDDTRKPAVTTMVEAVEVRAMLLYVGCRLYIRLYTMVHSMHTILYCIHAI